MNVSLTRLEIHDQMFREYPTDPQQLNAYSNANTLAHRSADEIFTYISHDHEIYRRFNNHSCTFGVLASVWLVLFFRRLRQC